MVKRVLALCVVVLALGACETTSEETGAASGGAVGGAGGSDVSGVSTLPPPGGGGLGGAGSTAVQRGTLGNPAEVERQLVSIGDTVYFAFDSYTLDGSAQATLDRQAQLLLGSAVAVTIEGHTDERGTREYNLALGERRATAVKDYLVAFGIEPRRLRTLSYGEERPAALGSTEAAWAKNRRAVSIVAGAAAGS